MPIELIGLVSSVALGIVHIVLASHSASVQRSYRWTASARDVEFATSEGRCRATFPGVGELSRNLSLFWASSTGCLFCRRKWHHVGLGVWLYVLGRVMYLLLYAFGVFLVRSLSWNVATLGIVLLGWALVDSAAHLGR